MKIEFFDGGMGSLLQAKGLQKGEAPDMWNIQHPDKVLAVHQAYAAAGSDYITTNTFGANRLRFENTEAIVKAGVELARSVGKKVALDLGPTGKLLKPMGELDFEEAVDIYAEVVRYGKSGADAVIIETISDTYEMKAALDKANVKSLSSSSGTGGTLSNGQNVDEKREQMTRQTLIDLTGDTNESYRNAGIFKISGGSNIIIRNLKFVGPGPCDVGGQDLITCTGTTHLWVDHCEFTDGQDGNFDITQSADFVTVSWCTFAYTERASGLFMALVCGGGILPLLMNGVVDIYGISGYQPSYWVAVAGFAYILYYALVGSKPANKGAAKV